MKTYHEILALIENQHTMEEIEACGLAVKKFLPKASENEKQTVKAAIRQHIDGFLTESKQAIAKADNYLVINGQQVDLAEWLTINEYAKRFGLKSTNVVSNRIKRGLIPDSNVFIVKELNNLKLIKAS